MILRRHIHKLLSDYYRQPYNKVVGSIEQNSSFKFKCLLGEWHWRQQYGELYKDQEGQWLTPVEIFRPYYSRIIANYIAQQASCPAEKIQIVEIGGGRGTNAMHIMDYLHDKHINIYNKIGSYTIMDASPTLLQLQQKVLLGEDIDAYNGENSAGADLLSTRRHKDIVHLEQKDMLDVAEGRAPFLEKSECLTIFLAMEVLDNLPHDKVSICEESGSILQAELELDIEKSRNNESIRDNTSKPQLKEVFKAVQDPLLLEMMEKYPKYAPSTVNRTKWVPTVATKMLSRLFDQRPNASVVLADFDYLPAPDLDLGCSGTRLSKKADADSEPLLTDMNDKDHECYLTAPPICDILFPTNFLNLKGYIENDLKKRTTCNRSTFSIKPWSVQVLKQSDFLSSYGPEEVHATKGRWTGYSPMLEDFTNCSILHVSRCV